MIVPPPNSPVSKLAASTKPSTVLVVSKSNSFAKRITDALVGFDAKLQYASHLSQATDLMDKDGQLCIVLDYDSPEVFDVPQNILKLREILALIVIAPENDQEAVFHAACMGALHVTNKPIDGNGIATIHAAIRSPVSNSATADARRTQQSNRWPNGPGLANH